MSHEIEVRIICNGLFNGARGGRHLKTSLIRLSLSERKMLRNGRSWTSTHGTHRQHGRFHSRVGELRKRDIWISSQGGYTDPAPKMGKLGLI